MQWRNTTQQYGWVSIVLHWLMALSIIGLFALGVWMVNLDYYDTWYHKAPWLHRSAGVLLLCLFMFRLLWRLSNVVPNISGQPWEKYLALWVHRGHYLWMFLVLVSGYLISTALGRGIDVFGWFEFPALLPTDKGRESMAGVVHMYTAWGFMAYIALHILAALKHHWIDKDNTLKRMFGYSEEKRRVK